MASGRLAPGVANHLIDKEEYVNMIQHPKVAAAILKLKADPKCFSALCAEDDELADLFAKMQAQMTAAEAEYGVDGGPRGSTGAQEVAAGAGASRIFDEDDDAPPLLILEDDVELLSPTFGAEAASLVASIEATFAPAEREVVLYVGAHVPQWRSRRAFPVLPGRVLREADYAWQTSSYLIWPAAARTLLGAMPIDCPVDNFLSKHFLEHRLRALVVLPNLAAQSSPYRDGDILHSNVFKPVVSVEPDLRRALEESQASIGETYEPPLALGSLPSVPKHCSEAARGALATRMASGYP